MSERREARQARRALRRERRQARRETLAEYLTPLIHAAELLISDGADRAVWVIEQFCDLVDLPIVDEDELAALLRAAVDELVARLYPH